ncbi:MAG: hydantoinase/oxoprolinase family protein [Granulosicoccaceae bacterium]
MTERYRLGIDTGGTYTDAVIVDTAGKVLASNKQLTTHGDLADGIGEAVNSLPEAMLAQVQMVALSTTLSTNSVVEGRGGSVCVLLPGYDKTQVQKSGLFEILDSDCVNLISGGHSATGEQTAELDIEKATQIINKHADKISAFAVSSIFATRNTAHEFKLTELIQQLTDKPVACGHQLAHALGAPRRALTTALNARMIQPIRALIAAVDHTLQQVGISAPMMIVNGDGSLVNVQMALAHPIATILSGPAASVSGACALSGIDDAVVVDIGGTTTDIAIARNGRAQRSHDGARIGDWKPLVDAIRVCAVGLGGDSEIRFNGKLAIEQRRVVPMSLLAQLYPSTISKLERQWKGLSTARQNKFAIALRPDADTTELKKQELIVWNALLDGPLEIEALAESNATWGRVIAKLERKGLAIYSGFTPTDAAHVLGLSKHWNKDAAVLGARLWARQMRYLYGCGTWEIGDEFAPSQQVFDMVVSKICEQIIDACLHQQFNLNDKQMGLLRDVLTKMILADNAADGSKAVNGAAVLNVQFDKQISIVGVGGSAPDYLPEVAKLLGMSLHIPEHASTANAIGSVFGDVMQLVRVVVIQPTNGVFMVFHQDTPLVFDALEPAMAKANEIATAAALAAATLAGGVDINVSVDVSSDHVKHDIDGELFVNATVTATAVGVPACLKPGP